MKRIQKVLLTIVALTPMLSACERADQISSIEEIGVSYSSNGVRREARPVQAAPTANVSGTDWAIVTPGTGATLQVDKFQLVIPRGAVRQATVFTMSVAKDGLIKVSLSARDAAGEVHEFAKPLKLTLPYSYASAADLASPGNFVIANVDAQNAILEIVNVSLDRQSETVSGNISHFSDYLLAKEIIIAID